MNLFHSASVLRMSSSCSGVAFSLVRVVWPMKRKGILFLSLLFFHSSLIWLEAYHSRNLKYTYSTYSQKIERQTAKKSYVKLKLRCRLCLLTNRHKEEYSSYFPDVVCSPHFPVLTVWFVRILMPPLFLQTFYPLLMLQFHYSKK